ncbi:hypothetical protein [Streptomyces sp. NPDC053755]|uniref:hypothetical protein n=1 Tax=Streptomyces sp. NPDC053755 TaxID=3155815 RepID=UPI00341DFC9A
MPSPDRLTASPAEEDIAALADHLRRFDSGIERLHGLPWPRPEGAAGAPHRVPGADDGTGASPA